MEIVDKLVEVFELLRDPDKGCPWDKKQTFESMAPYILEEAWEVVNALNNKGDLCEELGDLLLNIMFLAQIAKEKNQFDFETVCKRLHKKLIEKHPHVFSGEKVSEEEVLKQWEGKRTEFTVSAALPSTMRARIASERALRHGIGFDSDEQIFQKIREELSEVEQEKDFSKVKEELGDLLFAMVELCRVKNVDPEIALNLATDKFLSRVQKVIQTEGNISTEEKWKIAKLDQ